MLLEYRPKIEHLKMVSCANSAGIASEKTMISLVPGMNEVSDKDWECIRGNLTKEIARGEVKPCVVKIPQGANKPSKTAQNLSELPVKNAKDCVRECNNGENLLRWLEEETRDEVRRVIEKRLEKLKIEIPEDDEKEKPSETTEE